MSLSFVAYKEYCVDSEKSQPISLLNPIALISNEKHNGKDAFIRNRALYQNGYFMWPRCLILVLCLWLVAVCSAQTESLPVCDPAPQQAAALTVSTYTASAFKTFIRLENGILWDGTESYSVRGLNYMPAQTPQYHFLIDTPDAVVRSDL